MSAVLPDEWLELIQRDYGDFIVSGGALVRFLVPSDESTYGTLREESRVFAEQLRLFFFEVDSAFSRLHYVSELLEAVAEQIDLRQVATDYLRRLIELEGFSAPGEETDFLLERVAELNDLDSFSLATMLKRELRARLSGDKHLVRDVRVALIQLCLASLGSEHDMDATEATISRWLNNKRLSSVYEIRRLGIFQRIDRYNARSVLRSILAWLPNTYLRGSVLFVDARQLAVGRHAYDGRLAYTKLGLLDAYEVMREFVDGVDEMQHVLILFVVSPEFLDTDPRGRGVGAYDALRYRVIDEVHDVSLTNPLAVTVRLSNDVDRLLT